MLRFERSLLQQLEGSFRMRVQSLLALLHVRSFKDMLCRIPGAHSPDHFLIDCSVRRGDRRKIHRVKAIQHRPAELPHVLGLHLLLTLHHLRLPLLRRRYGFRRRDDVESMCTPGRQSLLGAWPEQSLKCGCEGCGGGAFHTAFHAFPHETLRTCGRPRWAVGRFIVIGQKRVPFMNLCSFPLRSVFSRVLAGLIFSDILGPAPRPNIKTKKTRARYYPNLQ